MSPGDHLVAGRTFYSHHGIYVGDGKVIHYGGLAEGFSKDRVRLTSLYEFRGEGNSLKIKHWKLESFVGWVRVGLARGRLDEDDYNIAFNNCEHFAHSCVFGTAESEQVQAVRDNLVAGAASLLTSLIPGVGLIAGTVGRAAGLSTGLSVLRKRDYWFEDV